MKYHEEHQGHKVMHKGEGQFEPIPSETEWVASQVVDAALAVHKAIGPGLLESVYEACLCHELATRSVSFRRQVSFPISYGGMRLDAGLKIDLIAADCVIVEIKSVDEHHPIFEAQLLTYLRLTVHRLGLLKNFNVLRLKDGIRRLVL
jgi:GxxExxY protein